MAYPTPTQKRSGMSAGLKMNENVQRKTLEEHPKVWKLYNFFKQESPIVKFYSLSDKYNKSVIKVI